ncbi:MAG: hypothetical protein RR365_13235 [Bacteroides sp.]
MAKKRKPQQVSASAMPQVEKDLITPQYLHVKELSKLKYEAEEKREQNLIQQSSQMQTVFSFMTAAIFMAVPVCVQYRGSLSLEFFLISISIIVMFLIASLVLASIAQWRWKTETFPDVAKIKESVIDSPEWEKFTIEYNQIDQWIGIIGKVQAEKAKLNDRRVALIMASMICFYCSILSVVISFSTGIIQLISRG